MGLMWEYGETKMPNELLEKGRALALELFAHKDGDIADLPLPEGDQFRDEYVAWVFGYLLQERNLLPVGTKVLGAIAMCTVLGRPDALRRWIAAAKRASCTVMEVRETIMTMQIYGGFPAARSALEVLDKTWKSTAP
jgi:4-carboxymuconolactone decarboxylase